MRKMLTTIAISLLAACGTQKDRSATVDTTLPNGTMMVSGGMNTDDEGSMTDNMTAVDSMMNDTMMPSSMSSDSYTGSDLSGYDGTSTPPNVIDNADDLADAMEAQAANEDDY